jgi:hypothetical protein
MAKVRGRERRFCNVSVELDDLESWAFHFHDIVSGWREWMPHWPTDRATAMKGKVDESL